MNMFAVHSRAISELMTCAARPGTPKAQNPCSASNGLDAIWKHGNHLISQEHYIPFFLPVRENCRGKQNNLKSKVLSCEAFSGNYRPSCFTRQLEERRSCNLNKLFSRMTQGWAKKTLRWSLRTSRFSPYTSPESTCLAKVKTLQDLYRASRACVTCTSETVWTSRKGPLQHESLAFFRTHGLCIVCARVLPFEPSK